MAELLCGSHGGDDGVWDMRAILRRFPLDNPLKSLIRRYEKRIYDG